MGFQNVITRNVVNRNHSVHKPVASIYLEDETAGSSEILVPIYQTTCCHMQKIITLCHHKSTYAHDKGKRFLYTSTKLHGLTCQNTVILIVSYYLPNSLTSKFLA